MKILVYMPQQKLAQAIFEEAVLAIQALKIRCELSCITDYSQVMDSLNENRFFYDIVILNPNDRECLHIAELLRECNFYCTIIFAADFSAADSLTATTTTKSAFALTASGAKPFTFSKLSTILHYRPSALIADKNELQLKNALQWALQEQSRINPFFTVKNKEEILKIHHSQIKWFESRQRTVILHAQNRDVVFYAKLSEVYEQIPQTKFLRCHQSYIVNTDHLKLIDKVHHYLYLTDGTLLEISKPYYQDVIQFFDKRIKNQ